MTYYIYKLQETFRSDRRGEPDRRPMELFSEALSLGEHGTGRFILVDHEGKIIDSAEVRASYPVIAISVPGSAE